jgi:hypothetical protein
MIPEWDNDQIFITVLQRIPVVHIRKVLRVIDAVKNDLNEIN